MGDSLKNSGKVLPKLTFTPEDFLKRDVLGRSLLHVMAIQNDLKNLNKFLKIISKTDNYHYILIDDVENHWNVLHYAIYYFNFYFVKSILNSNNPVLAKLLNHKDKNRLTPWDLISTYLFSFKNSSNQLFSIQMNGKYKIDSSIKIPTHSTSLLISTPNGDFANIDLTTSLFPPYSNNQLLQMKIKHMVACSTHSAFITTSGHLYLSNPNTTLNPSSFCRVKFFDELLKNGEYVIDISITPNHNVVLTSANKVYTFGTDSKRIYLYQAASSILSLTSSNSQTSAVPAYFKDFHSLVPLTVGIKYGVSSSTTNVNSLTNNFAALSLKFSSSESTAKVEGGLKLIGVSSSNNHTVVCSKQTLHIFGLNVGQFGPLTNTIKSNDKDLTSSHSTSAHIKWKYSDDPIKNVFALDLATIVVTESSLLHIYSANLHFKVALPSKDVKDTWNIFKPSVLSMPQKVKKIVIPVIKDTEYGNLNSTYSVLILLESGQIVSFTFPKHASSKESFYELMEFTNIWEPSRKDLRAIDVAVAELKDATHFSNLILCTELGEVFRKNKSKWSKINDLNKITKIAIGYGFSYQSNNFANDINKSKLILLREDDCSLKHEIPASSIARDFGKLSPLSKLFDQASDDTLTTDINFFCNKEIGTGDDFQDDIDGDCGDFEIPFTQYVGTAAYKSNLNAYDCFKSEEEFCEKFLLNSDCSDLKSRIFHESKFEMFYDYPIRVKNTASNFETTFQVHKKFFFERIGIHKSSHELHRKDLECIFDEDEALIIGHVDIRSVALFIHMLYTDESIDLWSCLKLDPLVKSSWERLLYTFPKVNMLESVNLTYFDDTEGDIIIKLSDGEVRSFKALLSCRCEYFKSLFSSTWDAIEKVTFDHISMSTWRLLMRYFIGDNNDGIFYELISDLIHSTTSKFFVVQKAKKNIQHDVERITYTPDNFINDILKLIDFSNELLLPNLSQLCQLALKDCINFDNYDILLQHAFVQRCDQLFANCAWYVFNNLSLCYVDPRLNINVIREDCALALESKIHDIVNIYLPERKKDVLLKSTKKSRKIYSVKELNTANVRHFKENMDIFNEYFLHPYLWDIYGISESKKLKQNNMIAPRRKSNNLFRSNSFNSNIDFNIQKLRSESVISLADNAIDDSPESDGFIMVGKDKRQFLSSDAKIPGATWISSRSYSNASSSLDISRKENSDKSRSSVTGSSVDMLNDLSGVGSSMPIIGTTPPISAAIDEILTSRTNKKPALKIKSKVIVPLKISQKERKKDIRKQQKEETQAKIKKSDKSPWSLPNAWGNTAPRVIDSPLIIPAEPILVAPTFEKKDISIATIIAPNKMNTAIFPSLSDVKTIKKKSISLEQNRIDLIIPTPVIVPVVETKSLDDIRAEEEFARWWEEESKRVQLEMNGGIEVTGNGSSDSNGSSHIGKNKTGRGSRGGSRGGRSRGRGFGKERGRGK